MADLTGMLQAAAGSGGLATTYTPILAPGAETINEDPFAEYLSLAIPVNGTYSYNDISATIKGSGSNKNVSVTGGLASGGKFYTYAGQGGQQATLQMDNKPDLTLTGPFCIELWYLIVSFGSFGFFFGNTRTDSGRGKGYKFLNGGESSLYMSWAPDGSQLNTTIMPVGVAYTVPGNTAGSGWHHVAWTRDENNIGRAYFDGQVYFEGAVTSNSLVGSDSFQFATSAYAYNGKWQDFRIYVGTNKYAPGGFSVP